MENDGMASDGACCGACGHAEAVAKGSIRVPPSPPLVLRGGAVVIALHAGKEIRHVASKRRITVGRGSAADVVIADSALSRMTFAIEIGDDGAVFVEDLGSTCGTYVNGSKVQRSGLHQRDEIRVGGTVIRVAPAP